MKGRKHLPSGWAKELVGNLFDVQLGKMLNEKAKEGEQHPYLANFNVRWGKFDLERLNSMAFSEREQKKYTLHYGDLLVCEGGEIGRCAVWKINRSGIYYQKALHRIRSKNEISSTEYFYFYMQYLASKRLLLKLVGETSIAHLTREKLLGLTIPLPPLPEQKAIADLLATWDEAIEKTKRLIQEKERRFKRLLRELIFEPRNTQKGAKWENVKLEQVCKIASKEKLSSVDGHFLLTVKLHCLGIERNDRVAPTLTERGRPYYQHKSGDFLIGRQNFHNGGFGIISPELDGGITSNAISCLIVNKSKLSKDFLWFQFANPNYYRKVGHVMDGTGQKELSDKQLLKLKICLPDLETQNQIAEILTSTQHEIDLLKQLADKYKTQKRGLMQKMLTGEWRVKSEIVNQYMEA